MVASFVATNATSRSVARDATLVDLHQFEKFPQPRFLVAFQMPGLGEHSLDHGRRLIPMTVHACAHELLGRTRSRAVRRNDGADDRRQFENDLHISPRLWGLAN